MKNLKVYNTQEKMKGKYNITENEKEVTRQTSSGKSYKLTKKVLAVALAATSVLSFAGCSNNNKKDFVLQDTLLENAVVATVSTDDGYETRILTTYQHPEINNGDIIGYHTDYIDIINGERITDSLDTCNQWHKEKYEKGCRVKAVNEVVEQGSVFSFLTEEELKLLNEGKEDEIDFVKVLVRIRQQEEAKRKVKQ